uniref:Uncharacterized protein n=1 Tax=Myoviridae sp. ctj3P51 TaxID=2826687 RepID=A0A8S5NNT2_9CAUD|nr:MAG TPA: hypothetical protein [Myoviridae sp. ctj3P51]
MDIKLTSKSKTLSTEHTYVPEDITVTAELQDKDVTPISTPQTVTAEPGYAGLGEVRIAGVPNCIEQIIREATNDAKSVSYNTASGATIEYPTKVVIYKDSTMGEIKTAGWPTQLSLPILPGKYVSMETNADNDALEVKVDDTALALDFYKVNKTSTRSVPAYSPTKGIIDIPCSFSNIRNSLVQRGLNGEANFNWILTNEWKKSDSGDTLIFGDVVRQLNYGSLIVTKTASNTGTLVAGEIAYLQKLPQYQIQYNKQTYYRMDPVNAPDDTLNYIHIDSVLDDRMEHNLMACKCFSVNVSSREWKVIDLTIRTYTHNIKLFDSASNTTIRFMAPSLRSTIYSTTSDAAEILANIGDEVMCVAQTGSGAVKAGILSVSFASSAFEVQTDTTHSYTFDQLSITDYVY